MIKATVIGRLVKEPKKFSFGDNREGVRFMVASNNSRSYQEEEAKGTFISAVIFRSNTYFDNNMQIGREMTLIGELTQEQRDDDGNLYPMNMTVDEITFGPELKKRNDESYNGGDDDVF